MALARSGWFDESAAVADAVAVSYEKGPKRQPGKIGHEAVGSRRVPATALRSARLPIEEE
jgi:hypothetical protein